MIDAKQARIVVDSKPDFDYTMREIEEMIVVAASKQDENIDYFVIKPLRDPVVIFLRHLGYQVSIFGEEKEHRQRISISWHGDVL